MSDEESTKNWFARHAESEAKKDIMSYYERFGNAVGFLCVILVVYFFAVHQMWSTGFFTSKFGVSEMFLFYASIAFGFVTNGLKILFGRKNLVRIFDVFGTVLSFVAVGWLFSVFPFEFAYLADVLPDFLRFLVQWISNDIARALMVIALVALPIATIYNASLYVFVRRELSKPTPKTEK